MFAGYREALAHLQSQVDVERMAPSRLDPERVFKLDRMRALVDALGNPERDTRFVHIVGSKGKGGTVEMLASCLGACRYAVGVFTSPHLVDLRERIRLGETPIDEADFTRLLHEAVCAGAEIPEGLGLPTYFELLTAVALMFYAEQAVDIAVLETGLGGRLDSTNVVIPEVVGVSAIQLEHTHILGDTLDKIAREKAGVFKAGIEAISVPQHEEAAQALREVAQAVGAPLSFLGAEIDFTSRFESSPQLGPHSRVSLTTVRSTYEHMPVPLMGHHQADNCGLVLAILDRLRERGFEAPEREVALGLAATPKMGRLEQVWDAPRIFVDGAHTPESLEATIRAIGAHLRFDSMVCVFGCAADKKVDDMLGRLAIGSDKVIFTRAEGHDRGADPEDLRRRFADICPKMALASASVKDAINTAHQGVGRDDLILVTGSFYVAGEAKRLLLEAKKKREG